MNVRFAEIAAVVGAVLVAVPAVADEAPAVARPVRHRQVERPVREAAPVRTAAAQPSWTGAQVGGQGGVSSMAQGFAEPGAHLYPFVDACDVVHSLCVETPFSFTGHKTSATGGAFLGYRIQFGSVVAGIEGDINAKSGSTSYSLSDSNIFRAESFTGSVNQGADGSIRGRLGWLVTPWTLVYGTGGVAFGNVSGSFGYTAQTIFNGGCSGIPGCPSVNGGGSWSTTRTGATGGGGVETLITPNLTLRLEYRYTDLGTFSENVGLRTVCAPGLCTSPSSNALINLHPTFQTVTVGVGYNF